MNAVVPFRPRNDAIDGAAGRDFAKPDREALPVSEVEKWSQEIREQPRWALQCDIDADYYDGHQLTAEILEKMRQKGFPAIIENLCRPTIDAVLGLEAKTRTDWVVKPDHDRWEEVALGLSTKLKEAERESKADRAVSDAYGAQIKTGLGWVEVSREIVPTRYPYRVSYVHRREIRWDWREQEPERWRYLVRRRWFDEDVLLAYFPKQARLIKLVGNGFSSWWDDVIRDEDTGLAASYEYERATSIEAYEYRDYLRKRMCLSEWWYRTWKSTAMLALPDGRWIEFDKKNDEHVAAVGMGLLVPQILPVPNVRLSYWVGPHRLLDIPSPYKHGKFPYVPFFGYREDRTGAPYGLVRSMRHQQDEVNARKAKMMWLLSAKRVITDEDAVADHNVAKDEVARPDAYIVLNKSRRQDSKFEVDDQLELSDQQFKVYEAAKKSLQDVAGVYQALLGKADAAESGVAINSLIEQGTTTLAETNDNYRDSRREVGTLLTELVAEDIVNGTTVMVGDGPQRHEITLNEQAEDEFGPTLKNDVRKAKWKVVLDDVPSNPTFRTQQLAYLAEFTKGLPDNLKALISDFIVEATDLPQRRAIGERLRQAMGIQSGGKPRNDEERKAMEAAAAEQLKAKELQERGAAAEVRQKELANDKTEIEIAQLASGDAEAGRKAEEDAARADEEAKGQEAVAKQVNDAIARLTAEAQQQVAALNKQVADLTAKVQELTQTNAASEDAVARGQIEQDYERRISEARTEKADAEKKFAAELERVMARFDKKFEGLADALTKVLEHLPKTKKETTA